MNFIQTPFNNRTNVAIMITELRNLLKLQTSVVILLMQPHLSSVKTNKQTWGGKNTLGTKFVIYPLN